MFRKVIDFGNFFQDYRKTCFVLINVSKHKTIGDFVQHIKSLFDLKGPICLTEDDVLLPDAECIALLTLSNGAVKVNSLDNYATKSSASHNKKDSVFVKTETNENSIHLNKKRREDSYIVDEGYSTLDTTDTSHENKTIKNDNSKNRLNEFVEVSNQNEAFHSNQTENVNAYVDSSSYCQASFINTIVDPIKNELPDKPKKRHRIRIRKRKKNINKNSVVSNECFTIRSAELINENVRPKPKHVRFDNCDEDTEDISKDELPVSEYSAMESVGREHNYSSSIYNGGAVSNTIEYIEGTIPITNHDHQNKSTQPVNKIVSDSNETWFSNLMTVKEQSQNDKPPVYKRMPKSKTNDVASTSCNDDITTIHSTTIEPNSNDLNRDGHLFSINDVVDFKILILKEDYTPTISDSVVGRVIKVSDESVKLKILCGKEICKPLLGKFALPWNDANEEEEEEEPAEPSDVIELFVRDMINPVKLTT